MSKSRNLSKTYMRFVNLVSAIRSLPALDAVEERVLNGLAATWATGARISVLEAMQLASDTSPTTVHRRLRSLRDKGLIDLMEDEGDSRVKYVVPTAVADEYFAKLGQAMTAATRGKAS